MALEFDSKFWSFAVCTSLARFTVSWIEQQRRSSGSVVRAVPSPGLGMAERAASSAWWIPGRGPQTLRLGLSHSLVADLSADRAKSETRRPVPTLTVAAVVGHCRSLTSGRCLFSKATLNMPWVARFSKRKIKTLYGNNFYWNNLANEILLILYKDYDHFSSHNTPFCTRSL